MTFRPWPRGWRARTACLLLVVVVAALAAAARSRPARPRDPETVGELLERLRAAGVPWHVTPVIEGGRPEQGAYLCDRPRRREELLRLGRWPELAPRWRGVVLADQHNPASFVGGWEENGVVVGDVSLYGDCDMLKRILAILGR
jgi:hypothetical protein